MADKGWKREFEDPTGTAFRMFECKKCGDRIWFE